MCMYIWSSSARNGAREIGSMDHEDAFGGARDSTIKCKRSSLTLHLPPLKSKQGDDRSLPIYICTGENEKKKKKRRKVVS